MLLKWTELMDGLVAAIERIDTAWKVDFVPYRLYASGPKGAQLLRLVNGEKAGRSGSSSSSSGVIDFRFPHLYSIWL